MPRGMIAGSYESIYRGSFMSFLILISLSIYSYLITLADIVTFNHVKDSWYLCLSVNTSRVFLSSKILTLGFKVYTFYQIEEASIYIHFLNTKLLLRPSCL
jgi:hypothetical protein